LKIILKDIENYLRSDIFYNKKMKLEYFKRVRVFLFGEKDSGFYKPTTKRINFSNIFFLNYCISFIVFNKGKDYVKFFQKNLYLNRGRRA